MNFMKLYIGDYQRDTGHLSIAEHGAYLLMLQHHYATEKPLPTGKALHRLLRAESRTDREAIDAVVAQFWQETNAGLINERSEIEIRKADHQRTVNQAIGKRGGRPRKTESNTESVIETKTESDTEPKANRNPHQTPDTRRKQPPTPKGADDAFSRFWSAYPRKVGKGAAEKAWSKARINGHADDVIAAVEQQAASEQWRKDGGQYIPNPATWLNQRRWEDEFHAGGSPADSSLFAGVI